MQPGLLRPPASPVFEDIPVTQLAEPEVGSNQLLLLQRRLQPPSGTDTDICVRAEQASFCTLETTGNHPIMVQELLQRWRAKVVIWVRAGRDAGVSSAMGTFPAPRFPHWDFQTEPIPGQSGGRINPLKPCDALVESHQLIVQFSEEEQAVGSALVQ